MADNVGISTGAGATIATDDVGGIQYQKLKLDLGGNGATLDLAAYAASGLVAETPLLPTPTLFFDATTGRYRAASGQVLGDGLALGAVPLQGSVLLGYNGVTYDRLQLDASKFLKVVLGKIPDVNQTGGPWAVSGSVSIGTPTVNQGTSPWVVGGAAASGLVATGNPVRLGIVTAGGIVQDLLSDNNRNLLVAVNNVPSVNQGTSPWVVGGSAASGVVATGNPVRLGMVTLGGIVQDLQADSARGLMVGGQAASGVVALGNPVRMGAVTAGGILQDLQMDVNRFLQVTVNSPQVGGGAIAYNPFLIAGSDGTNARYVLVDSSGRQQIIGPAASGVVATGNPLRMGAVTAGGIVQDLQTDVDRNLKVVTPPQAVWVTGPAAVSGTVTAQGTAAHDTALVGAPIRGGARAASGELAPVAAGNACDLACDRTGKQIALPYAVPENFIVGQTGNLTNTTDTLVIAASGAAVRHYITQVVVMNSHATVSTWVNLKDNTTTLYTVYAPAAGGGVSVTLPVPLKLSLNVALNAACETTGANVRVSASGYKGS